MCFNVDRFVEEVVIHESSREVVVHDDGSGTTFHRCSGSSIEVLVASPGVSVHVSKRNLAYPCTWCSGEVVELDGSESSGHRGTLRTSGLSEPCVFA